MLGTPLLYSLKPHQSEAVDARIIYNIFKVYWGEKCSCHSVCLCTSGHTCVSENNLWDSVLPFHHEVSGCQFGGKHPSPLSYLTSPDPFGISLSVDARGGKTEMR